MQKVMGGVGYFELARARCEELLREARQKWLVKEVSEAHEDRGAGEPGRETIRVRWSLATDDIRIADLLHLNGVPRWIAFDQSFIVAEHSTHILAAVRYWTEQDCLRLGLLVADPRNEERRLAVALYAKVRKLAKEEDLWEIRATPHGNADYLAEAGYRSWGGGWVLNVLDAAP